MKTSITYTIQDIMAILVIIMAILAIMVGT